MLRLFKESLTRQITDLDGLWYYCTDPSGAAKWQTSLPESKLPIIVPSCWNNEPEMLQYEGDVWLETEFYTTQPNIRIVFGAVNNECDIYVDGAHIGYHYGPFTEFSFVLTDMEPGQHKLIVRTSNLHNEEDTIPLSNVDWFHYGGIIRSVEVHEFQQTAIDSVKLEYTLEGNTVSLAARVSLRSFSPVAEPVCLILGDKVLDRKQVSLNGTDEITLHANLKGVSLWSPESPTLYTFTVSFGNDTIRERTGFRSIEIRDRQFLLNGVPIYFKGVNRHEEHPEWGFAVPVKIAKKDIDIIRHMGCNFIRGSHYPNAKTTLDYMDEIGMLFWEEIPMWQYHENHLENELVLERGVYLHTKMVTRDYNHPCVVVWGLFNEVWSESPQAKVAAKLFRDTIRKHDSSRLITYASHHCLEDICYQYADFISVNKYLGWYGDPLTEWPAFIDALCVYLDSTGNKDKPIVISEFGAGAIYGAREMDEGLYWTENYQKEYLEYTLDLFMHHKRIHGALIWQFCDIRSGTRFHPSGIRRLLSRPRSFNNKGILNEYRSPKLAYYSALKAFKG